MQFRKQQINSKLIEYTPDRTVCDEHNPIAAFYVPAEDVSVVVFDEHLGGFPFSIHRGRITEYRHFDANIQENYIGDHLAFIVRNEHLSGDKNPFLIENHIEAIMTFILGGDYKLTPWNTFTKYVDLPELPDTSTAYYY